MTGYKWGPADNKTYNMGDDAGSSRNNKTMYTSYSGNLSMSGSFTPEGTVANNGHTESKPINVSTKLWKRVS
ncbi:MAG: hypothetical protein MJZ37_11185 [Bacilli bacterium]|nr:hypothetical protein [Bacilli bacterium]